ncbi:MAG: tetratricopeptide repeat protein [candidate division Zixibacteria bacterium]|nr:tetratricopeptide repeat protein [candidate division Zixibacteria bacterium]
MEKAWPQTAEDIPQTARPSNPKDIREAITSQTRQLERLLEDEARVSGQSNTLKRLIGERKRLEEKIARENLVISRLEAMTGILEGQVAQRATPTATVNRRVGDVAWIRASMPTLSQEIREEISKQTNPVLRDIRLAQLENTITSFRDSLIQYISPQDIGSLSNQDFDVILDWYLKVQYVLVEPVLKDFIRAYPNSQNYDQALLILGDIYRYQSRYEEAIETFRALTTRETTSSHKKRISQVKLLAYALLEDIYYRQGRYDEALTSYYTVADQLLRFPEYYDGALYIAGHSFFKKALSRIRDKSSAPASLPENQRALLDSAISVWSNLTPITPLYLMAQEGIALAYIEQGQLEKAIQPLVNAKTTQPPLWADTIIFESIWSSIARLGHLYLELSRKTQDPAEVARYRDLAVEEYSLVPEEALVYDEVILALATLEFERNNTENGIKLLETMLDIRPGSKYAYEVWILLGEGYTRIKEYSRARDLFSQLVITQRAIALIDSTVRETRDMDNVRLELERLSLEAGSGANESAVNRITAQLDSIAEKRYNLLALHTRLFDSDPLALELINHGQLKVMLTSLSGLLAGEQASLNALNRDLGTMEGQALASARSQDAIWRIRQEARDVQQTQSITSAFDREIKKGLSFLNSETPISSTRWMRYAEFGKVNIDFIRYQAYKTSIREQYEGIGTIYERLKDQPPGDLRTNIETVLTQLRDQITGIEGDLSVMRGQLITDLSQAIQRYPDNPAVELSLFRLGYVQYDQTERDFLAVSEAYSDRIDRGVEVEEAPRPDYGTPIRTYERFISQFSASSAVDQAYFQLGHLLSEQGELEQSNRIFEALVQQYPRSPLVPDAYLRIGDFYFDALYLGLTDMGGEDLMGRAISAYDRVLDYPDNRNYQNALYKLGWSFYNLAAPELREQEYDKSIEYFTALLDDSLSVARYNQLASAAGIEPKQLDPGYDLTSEAIKYIAINFRDRVETGREDETRRWATQDVAGRMKRYVESIGKDKPYARSLMMAMADVYKETGQVEAEVVALDSLLALLPDHPQSPRVLQRMIDGYEDIQQMALADPTVWKNEEHNGQSSEVFLNRARERLFRDFGRKWAETLPESSDRADALVIAERAGWRLANYVASQAEAGGDPSSGIKEAARYYYDYLNDFPEGPNAYTARWNYAQYMWRLENFPEAFEQFLTVSRDEKFDKYRQEAALNVIRAAEKMLEVEQKGLPAGGAGVSVPSPGAPSNPPAPR